MNRNYKKLMIQYGGYVPFSAIESKSKKKNTKRRKYKRKTRKNKRLKTKRKYKHTI